MFGDLKMVELGFKRLGVYQCTTGELVTLGQHFDDILACGSFKVQSHKAYVSRGKMG